MVEYEVTQAFCPQCGVQLRKGTRRFGPARVVCGNCKAILRTGLDQWADLSTGRKIAVSLAEILTPSWIRATDFRGVLVWALVHPFLCVMLGMPFSMIFMHMEGDPAKTFWLVPLGSLIYPTLLVVRVALMIRESSAYTRRGKMPVWGKRVGEEQAKDRAVASRYRSRRYRIVLRLLALVLAGAWFALFSVFVRSTPLLTAGLTANSQRAGIAMAPVHVVGSVVMVELARCMGYRKRTTYSVAVVTLLFAPIALLIAALLMRHRVNRLISTIKSSDAAISRGRATGTEIVAYNKASRELADVRSPTAVEPLTRYLRDWNADIRRMVASVLGEIGDRRAVAPLIRCLGDKDDGVRSSAATALGKIGDTQATEALNAALKDESDDVRSAAAQALDAITGNAEA
jgi:hypothetical protein